MFKKGTTLFFTAIFLFFYFFIFLNTAHAYKPSDPLLENQSYLTQINVREAWDTAKGNDIVVAVIDSGVDFDHPDLADNIWVNAQEIAGDNVDNDRNGYIDDTNGWDFIDDDNSPVPDISGEYDPDAIGHGTAVAGIIAAKANNGEGIAGIAFQAEIMSLRVLDVTGEGDVSDVIKAIRYAVNNGADIINLSFVGYDSSQEFNDVITWAESRSVLVVASAGNDNENLDDKPTYPACYNEVLAVASVDSQDRKSSFSNYGGCVHLSSPGNNLYSTYFQDNNNEDFVVGYKSNLSGTSFAAAIISGVSALVKSNNQNLTPRQIIEVLTSSADNINSQNPEYRGLLGGRINAAKALGYKVDFQSRLVKLADASAVYYVDNNNQRHLFPNATVFWSWYQGSWLDQNIEVVSPTEFGQFSIGKNITVRPGTELIQFKGMNNIYIVLPQNELCKIQDNIFNREPKIISVGFETDYRLKIDCLIKNNSQYPDGSLIQYLGSDNIYYLENGKKRAVSNTGFTTNNFNTQYIIKGVNDILSYPTGVDINNWENLIYFYH